ncbi:hypothetical protein [Sutcliffiella halmapala]|uniref:hypothetical protein n=1 Tax=Sutcliffiella halmapala TaxID=79882 RepID=UPI000995A544|nr:hypothetical protein [Sutcliffiella halmapala]
MLLATAHNSLAVQSHSIWKSGILKLIAKITRYSGLIQTTVLRYLESKKLFSSVIIKNATIYRGFCDTHDNNLFKEIEKDEIYVERSIQMFLYSYRAFSYQHVQDTLSSEVYELFEEEATKLFRIKQLNGKEIITIRKMVENTKEHSARDKRIFDNTCKEFHNIFRLIEDKKDYTNELDIKFILKSYKINKKN